MLSCRVEKWNSFVWKQQRNLIVTNANIYNYKKKECKRVIPIAKLAGLTKSTYKESKEFVIHVRNDYDYRMSSELREQIFTVIKMAYLSIEKKNLPIYGLPKVKTLEDFTTTEKDLSRGIIRMPLALARLSEEDILKDQVPSLKKDMSMDVDQLGSLDEMVNLKR